MNNTNTITYQFISVPTVRNLHAPLVSITVFLFMILVSPSETLFGIILDEGVDATNLRYHMLVSKIYW
jgi:hypothetical protein